MAAVATILKYALPPKGSTYNLLDALWVEGDRVGSIMCNGDCCPAEGYTLSELPEEA